MNNTFEIKRFGQVLAKDWKDYFRNFGISLIVWSCIPILFWIATMIFDTDMGVEGRIALIASLVFSVLIFVPSKVYGKANQSRDGVSFAILPATNAEKFFSMLIYCSVLTPIIVGLGSWAIDTLLTLLPFGGFEEFVMLPKSHLGMQLLSIGSAILLMSSIFVFGNMVFKKRKAGKTIAWSMLIMFVITMLFQVLNVWTVLDRWFESLGNNGLLWVYIGICLVFAILFYYLTYRKIKNQKY